MNLAQTDLPLDMVAKLRDYNIRDVETFLSMIDSPTGLIAISRLLKLSIQQISEMSETLKTLNPELVVENASASPRFPMGYRAPLRKSD